MNANEFHISDMVFIVTVLDDTISGRIVSINLSNNSIEVLNDDYYKITIDCDTIQTLAVE